MTLIDKYKALERALLKACEDMINLGVNPFHHSAVEPEDEKLLETLCDANTTDAEALADYYVMKVCE